MNLLLHLLDARLTIGGIPILWREIIGNAFGLASAVGGMRRSVWAWPIGIFGNALLFTVFLGGVFHTPQNLDLYGQSGRQVMFIIVSLYGWQSWARAKRRGRKESTKTDPSRSVVAAIQPRWASTRARWEMLVVAVVGTILCATIFRALNSWSPWVDAWVFIGSVLATYGMARGYTEFWLIWIAVDIVGVPLLVIAGYYPSAMLYVFYAAFVIWGFIVWHRVQQSTPQASSSNDVAKLAKVSDNQ